VDKKRPSKSLTVPVRTVTRAQGANYLRKAEQHLAEALEALSAERWDTAAPLAIQLPSPLRMPYVSHPPGFARPAKLMPTSLGSFVSCCRMMKAPGALRRNLKH